MFGPLCNLAGTQHGNPYVHQYGVPRVHQQQQQQWGFNQYTSQMQLQPQMQRPSQMQTLPQSQYTAHMQNPCHIRNPYQIQDLSQRQPPFQMQNFQMQNPFPLQNPAQPQNLSYIQNQSWMNATPEIQSQPRIQNLDQKQTQFQTQNLSDSGTLSQNDNQPWIHTSLDEQSPDQTQYLPQNQVQHSLHQQRLQHFEILDQSPLTHTDSFLSLPYQGSTQWQPQRTCIVNDYQNLQPDYTNCLDNTSFNQIQQRPVHNIHQYQASPATPPEFVQPALVSYSGIPPTITQRLPAEGATREMAIVLEDDNDGKVEQHQSPAATYNSSPPAPKKPEYSHYSDMFAERDIRGRKLLDENGKPIRLSIEKMVRRPGRAGPDLRPESQKKGPHNAGVKTAAKTSMQAQQEALEEAVLVEPEKACRKKERKPSLKRHSSEAECISESASKKRRAEAGMGQSPASQPTSSPKANSDHGLFDDDDSLFGDFEIDQTLYTDDTDGVCVPEPIEPLSIMAENSDISNVHVPELPKRKMVRVKPRLPAHLRPRKRTFRMATKVVQGANPSVETPEWTEAYDTWMAKAIADALEESDDNEDEKIIVALPESPTPSIGQKDVEEEEPVASRPRPPSPISDEDEDENFIGNIKYRI